MEALAREEIGELDPGAARFPPHHAVGGPEGGRHIELLRRHVDQRFPRGRRGLPLLSLLTTLLPVW